MQRLKDFVRRFAKDEDGIAIAEYGILLGFLAIFMITIIVVFRGKFDAWWTAITDKLTEEPDVAAPPEG